MNGKQTLLLLFTLFFIQGESKFSWLRRSKRGRGNKQHGSIAFQTRGGGGPSYQSSTNKPQSYSAINFRESIFKNQTDYATWTQYLCEKLYEAGDYQRLNNVAQRVQSLSNGLSGNLQTFARTAYRRYTDRYGKWRQNNQHHSLPHDPTADRYFDLILKGRYFDAKREITNMLAHRDYMNMSLSMKYVIILAGLVQYDGMNPKAVLTIWSNDWNLDQNARIASLIRAKQLCIRARQNNGDPRYPNSFRAHDRMSLIDARVLSNLGRDVRNQFNERGLAGSPQETGILEAGMSLINTDYCRARDLIGSFRNYIRFGTSRREDVDMMLDRSNEMCNRKQLDSTYRAFCQVGHENSLPIGEASSNGHTEHIVATHERMYWAKIAAGDCGGARHEYSNVRRSVPWNIVARRDYLSSRFNVMEKHLRECRTVTNIIHANGSVGQRILDSIQRKDYNRAENEWKGQFQHRPQDYHATIWRKTIMVARYPKTLYAPCIGNSILTGNANEDRELFEKLEIVISNKPKPTCWKRGGPKIREDKCNLLWMKAAYIANNAEVVHQFYRWVRNSPHVCNAAHQLVACTTLCNSGQGAPEACESRTAYNRLSFNYKRMAHNQIGIDLSNRMCQTNKQIVLDSFYIRHGNTPRPLSYLFRHYFKNFLYEKHSLFPHHEGGGGGGGGARHYKPSLPVQSHFGGTPPVYPGPKAHSPAKVHHHPHHPTKPKKHSSKKHSPKKHSSKKYSPKKHSPKKNHGIKGVKLPIDHQKAAILQAHAILCPCLKKKLMKQFNKIGSGTACKGGAKGIQRLVNLFKKFLLKENVNGCGCVGPRKFNSKQLATSGALQAAANMIAQGKLVCPCIKRSLLKKHRVKFTPTNCYCPCRGFMPIKKACETSSPSKRIKKHKKHVRHGKSHKHSNRIKHKHAHHRKHGISKTPVQNRPSVNKSSPKNTSECMAALVKKYPFLTAFIDKNHKKKRPCKAMRKSIKRVFKKMLKEVENECERGMLRSMMQGHSH